MALLNNNDLVKSPAAVDPHMPYRAQAINEQLREARDNQEDVVVDQVRVSRDAARLRREALSKHYQNTP